MIMKQYKATYTDTDGRTQGKVTLETPSEPCPITYRIMNWHTFDDGGATLETVQVWNPITKRLLEVYSSDEGETFTFDMQEA